MSLSVLSSSSNPTEEQLAYRQKEVKKYDSVQYGNEDGIEIAWAEKAFAHTQIYFKLICSINCTKLKLTKFDEELYQHFLVTFPRVKIDVIDEDKLKTPAAKRRWRSFCQMFEYHVEDYNFGTLLRLDCKDGYSESNTTLVPRVQFLAIEVARNRQGLNMCHFGSNPAPASKQGVNEGETHDDNKASGCEGVVKPTKPLEDAKLSEDAKPSEDAKLSEDDNTVSST